MPELIAYASGRAGVVSVEDDDDIKRRHKQFKHMACSNMPFQKGNQLAKNGPMRRDTTVELITQLNELIKCADGSKRAKLHRLIKNLIAKATTADDVLDKDGNIIKEGTGDLSAIQEIINRLEGKPSQKIVGPDNGPVRVEYRTIEEVRMFLLRTRHRLFARATSSNEISQQGLNVIERFVAWGMVLLLLPGLIVLMCLFVPRPLGGLLADRIGGAMVTFWNFIAMGAATIGVV